MAGDSASFDRGMRKAAFAPLRALAFSALALAILLFGRMTVDLVWTGSDPAKVSTLHQALFAELDAARQLPPVWGPAPERARRWAVAAYEWLYVVPGIDRLLASPPEQLSSPEVAMQRGMKTALAQPRWQAVLLGTQALAARAALLPTALPTLALAYTLAILDGLIARSIRRAAGGRESATRYHRAKYLHATLASVLVMLYFWWPTRVELSHVALILAVAGGLLLRVQVKFYKKYW